MISWFTHRNNRQRLYRWSTILGGFAVVQLLVQALNALAGFLLVRAMEKPDYAWFTIASGMSAALSILSDSGVGNAVTSIGGRIWQDHASLKGLVQAAMRLRWRLTILASAIVACASIWLLRRNGAGFWVSCCLTLLVIAPIWQVSTTAVFNVVNRLHSRTRELQVADLVPAVVRTVLTAGMALLGVLTPATALAAVLIAQMLQYFIVRRQVISLLGVELEPTDVEVHSVAIWKLVRQLMPNCVFICIQGQLTTWLISAFATSSEVADLGALSRISIIYAVLGGPLTQYVCPAFARAREPRRLWIMAATLMAVMLAISCLLLLFCWFKGEWFLWLLGAKYASLHHELLLVLGGAAISSLGASVWGLNIARGWLYMAWLNIPLTLGVQTAAACLISLNSVQGVAWFVIVTAVMQCVHAMTTCLVNLWRHKRVE
jgi:O-antigen/teichoic acid export membrane protein